MTPALVPIVNVDSETSVVIPVTQHAGLDGRRWGRRKVREEEEGWGSRKVGEDDEGGGG